MRLSVTYMYIVCLIQLHKHQMMSFNAHDILAGRLVLKSERLEVTVHQSRSCILITCEVTD